MNPTIHNYKADDLDTQGFGSLVDCISCEISEELNGEYTLELKYPLDGKLSEYLLPSNIIVAKPNHKQVKQPFRINEVKKSFGNSVEVFANHISYDLSGYGIRAPRSYNSLWATLTAMNQMTWTSETAATAYHQFTFTTDMTSERPFSIEGIQSLRSWMGGQEGSILDTYGGEWEYNGFDCCLKSRRGSDTGIRISYGKNLAEYEKDRENDLYSHVVAYWKKSETVLYSDFIGTNTACTFRVAFVDVSKEYEDAPTSSQLNQSAYDHIAKMKMFTQTIKVKPAELGNDSIGLGDSVLICYEDVFETRVIKTVWDALSGVYKTLELGQKKESISDTIKKLSDSGGGSNSIPEPMDYVTEYGTDSDWTYRKWKSGLMECWYRKTLTNIACTSTWGSLKYGTLLSNTGINYPQGGFSQYPELNMTLQVAAGSGWAAPNYDNYNEKRTGGAYIYSPVSGTYNVTLNIYAKGYM